MTSKALVGAFHDDLGVVHRALDRFLVTGGVGQVVAEPSRRRTMAGFAAHAFGRKVATAQGGRYVEGVAQQALLGLLWVADAEDASHSLGDGVGKNFGRAPMTILRHPPPAFRLQAARPPHPPAP